MLKEIQETMDLLDRARVTGEDAQRLLSDAGVEDVEVQTVEGKQGSTDFITAHVPGNKDGAPTLGIIGRLGGVGARPNKIGLVSDADGAIVALACAAKLGKMAARGDRLPGDVIISTHICPRSPIIPHEPTPFMDSPVDMAQMNLYEVNPGMDAILSIDTTKGNWVVNQPGFAITPTVKEGYILRVSDHLLDIMRIVLNAPPVVLPITTQDITPYGNNIYHINSILQPATATSSPVVGVATTASTPIPGSASGANQPFSLEVTARFCIEVAKAYTAGEVTFYDKNEFAQLTSLYGSLRHFQTPGELST